VTPSKTMISAVQATSRDGSRTVTFSPSGNNLYPKLLDEGDGRAVQDGPGGASGVYMDLEYSGFIPDSYIPDAMEKLEVHKKIAGISTEEEFERVCREIEDCLGPEPPMKCTTSLAWRRSGSSCQRERGEGHPGSEETELRIMHMGPSVPGENQGAACPFSLESRRSLDYACGYEEHPCHR
jgi:hypothetical protein